MLSTIVWQDPWTARPEADGATGDAFVGRSEVPREHPAKTQIASKAARGNFGGIGYIVEREGSYGSGVLQKATPTGSSREDYLLS